MNVNVLVRGQSNAIIMMENNGWEGYGALVDEIQKQLGFDGVKDTVSLVYDRYDPNNSTAHSGTAFLGEWVRPKNGDWHQGWETAGLEQSMLNEIGSLPSTQKDDPTVVVWLHSEYDSRRADLTPEEWMSAVRYDAGLVRAAFGASAADLPYLFVSAHPYWGTNEGHQAIRQGMERLSADASFNAEIAARALDLNIDNDDTDGNQSTREYGGSHISTSDALILTSRIGKSVAESLAEYAKAGSAAANGTIADEGPQVIEAISAGGNTLRLRVDHDVATGFKAMDSVASSGVGWSIRTDAGQSVEATSVRVESSDTLLVTFNGSIPAEGKLFYGWGYGRLAGPDGTGQGHAIYDTAGMPIWTSAEGVRIGVTASPPPPVTSLPPAPVSPPPPPPPVEPLPPTPVSPPPPPATTTDSEPTAGKTVAATLSADTFSFRSGDGEAVGAIKITGFEVGVDKLDVVPLSVNGWTYNPWIESGATGSWVQWSWASNDRVFLSGVKDVTLDKLTTPTVVASPPPPVSPPPVSPPPVSPPPVSPPPVSPPPVSPPPVSPPPVSPPPVSTHPALSTAVGTGPDTIVLKISQDFYAGDAQYVIRVDGKQIGGTLTASAVHGSGQADTLTVQGDWAAGTHKLEVQMINDLWGGTPETDRNLHVESASYNGASLGTIAMALHNNNAGSISFTEAAPPSPPVIGRTIVGTSGADSIVGGAGADTISGGSGNDSLVGGEGADVINGDAGNDVMRGGLGNDSLTGGSGIDTLVFQKGDGLDVMTDFLSGTDKLKLIGVTEASITTSSVTRDGVAGLQVSFGTGDSIFLKGVTALKQWDIQLDNGGTWTPKPVGTVAAAPAPAGITVSGTIGDDWLKGGAGGDTLLGGSGSDDLQGMDGDDVLRGGKDDDGLTGGAGKDTIVFARGDGSDWVTDFKPGEDRLLLEGIKAGETVQTVQTRWGSLGLEVDFGNGDEMFLVGVNKPLTSSDMLFA